MLKRFVVFSIIGIACLLTQDALAALDLNPPTGRGEPSSTYQVWDFDTDTNLVETDLTPKTWATIVYNDVFPASWIEEGGNQFVPRIPLDHGRQGSWYIGEGDWTMIHIQDTVPQTYTICIDNMAFDVMPESINDGTIWGVVPW